MNTFQLDMQDVIAVDSGLWSIGQMFNGNDFDLIKNQLINLPDNIYNPSPAHPTHRFELEWTKCQLMEQLWSSLAGLNKYVSNLVGTPVKFGQVRVWKDLPGFMIPFHEDDQSSAAHIQIYISSPTDNTGTTWYTDKGRTTFPFVENSGYLTLCEKRYPHGMMQPVSDGVRYSLYATFAKDI